MSKDCPLCGCKMVLLKKVKVTSFRTSKQYNKKRFGCVNCDHTEAEFGSGNKEIIEPELTKKQIKNFKKSALQDPED